MIMNIIPLVKWDNGILMIGVFALVVVLLVGAVIVMINSGSSSKND